MIKTDMYLIGGPTASGKSAKALEIAATANGVVINADAMQIYAGLPILTAQPSVEDMRKIPHELYSIADVGERFSVGKWLEAAAAAIERAEATGKTPILVGGTGMYFKALLDGLADIPEIPKETREEAQKLYEEIGSAEFRKRLMEIDELSAKKIKPNDRQRLVRAYEVVIHTGKTLGHWQSKSGAERSAASRFEVKKFLVMPQREELYSACDKRFSDMMEKGAVEEVRRLLNRGLSPDLPPMKILGVREISAFLNGEISKEEAMAKAQKSTRNYAKRQMTWFRNQWKR